MELFAPRYYQKFKCIADRCTHSCCVGWEIDVDEVTQERYRALSGALGERVRGSLAQGEDGVHFALRPDGRCPHLDERGLCEIIKEAGEGYLCEICREHPRFYNIVGTHMECGLGASCEAAAALILTADYTDMVQIGEEDCCEENEAAAELHAASWREDLYRLLSDAATPYERRLALVEERFGVPAQMSEDAWHALFDGLEYLDAAHKALFPSCGQERQAGEETACERFLAYLIYRHASPAESEWEFRLSVGLSLVLERLFRALIGQGTDPVRAAVIVSEEMEYSEENTAAIRAALAGLY